MNDKNIQTPDRTPQTVSSKHKGFGVAASPFNAVKLELAIILVLGIVLGLLLNSITPNDGIQIAVLAGYGIAASGWILIRTRRVTAKALMNQAAVPVMPHQAQADSANTPSV